MVFPTELEAPGGTPLVAFELGLGPDRTVRLSLKLEARNPLGSIKDRPAAAMLADLDRQGRLGPGTRIIESSSGNLAVALAGRCRQRGIGFIAVVDPKITPENLERLEALGAEIVQVDQRDATGGYLLSRLALVKERCAADPTLVWTDQYHNQANPTAHRESTAPELHTQMGDAQAIFVAVSTGGTYAGLSQYFGEQAPDVAVIPVDVEGSLALGWATPQERHLPGIGASQTSRFVKDEARGSAEIIPEGEAVASCRWLRDTLDLSLGASSGASIAGCVRYLRRHPDLTHVVCLCPDSGTRYASTVYDDAWCQAHDFVSRIGDSLTIRPLQGDLS